MCFVSGFLWISECGCLLDVFFIFFDSGINKEGGRTNIINKFYFKTQNQE